MLNTLIGKKINQSQAFLEDGTRIPVTEINVKNNIIVALKSHEKNDYSAVAVGFGTRKKAKKTLLGQLKAAKLQTPPEIIREIRINDEQNETNQIGNKISPTDIFQPGDLVNVIGTSKGKGFAGGVKRHGFKGGPRTHGQSDRERAPGSIGQTTTPGRVYKGKRMAGRMGSERVTVRNLEIVAVSEDKIFIKGLVPGSLNSLVTIKKIGENKKFIPLHSQADEKTATTEAQNKKEAQKISTSVKLSDSLVAREESKDEEAEVEKSEETTKEEGNGN